MTVAAKTPTIRLRKSPKGRNFGWRCTCGATVNSNHKTIVILLADEHAKMDHPDGSLIEAGGLS